MICSAIFYSFRSIAHFLISISSFVRKIDALRWTPHMDECLRVLSANPECTNDETLIRQVQLQLIVEKVGHLQEETGEFTEYPKDFPNFYLQALNLQHQEIDTQISIYSPPNGRFLTINRSQF